MTKSILKIFLGVCLMLGGVGMLICNLFFLDTGFEAASLLLTLVFLAGGLLLTVFSAASLPDERADR